MSTVSEVSDPVVSGPALGPALRAVALVIPGKRCPKPVLHNASLRSGNGCLDVHATDLECMLRVTIGDPDEALFTAHTLVPQAVIKGLGTGPVSMTVKPDRIVCGAASVPTDDKLEYPCAGSIMSSPPATVPVSWLSQVERAVCPATDDESSRFALGGVLVESASGGLRAVGSDGRRLHALTRADVPGHEAFTPGAFIIPERYFKLFRRAMAEVVKAMPKPMQKAAAAGWIELRTGSGSRGPDVEFRWDCGPITLRLRGLCIQGRFPRYRDVFPDGCMDSPAFDMPIDVATAQVKAAAQCATEASKGVQFANGRLAARSADKGEYDAPAQWPMPATVKTKLDPAFLVDAMAGAAACGADSVPVSYTDEKSAVFMGVNGGLHPTIGVGYAVAIMPLAAD